MIEDLLDSLCAHFDDELERQETVLAVTIAQGSAVRARDIAALEARTEALNVLLREASAAERTRLHLVREIVDHYGLPLERQTLSGLIGASPEPWKSRMLDFQARMREVAGASREAVRENASAIRRSKRIVDGALARVSGEMQPDGAYTARAGSGKQAAAALMDQKG